MGKRLGIAQPEVFPLMNAHSRRFMADKLFDFLRRLDQTGIIRMRPHRRGEPYQEVSFAAQCADTTHDVRVMDCGFC